MTFRPFILTLACAMALSARVSAAAPSGTDALPLTPCHLSIPQATVRIAARCGSFSVAENPADADGRRIELAVAMLPSTSRQRVADPLVFITGGPGQSALESYVLASGAFRRIGRDRDILLVDQRGTGKSNRLSCTIPDSHEELTASRAQRQAWMRACLDGLPGDPRFYTTSVAIRDLDAVRAALGYERLNLYGVSYGSRVAQAYARRYPERTRAVILDGVVPMDLALGPDISLDAQRALRLLFQRCADDSACNERFPALAESFAQVQAQLRESPLQLVLADPVTAELTELMFSDDYFTSVIRMFSYAPETVALLPLLIDHAAAYGDFAPLAAQALLVMQDLGDSIAAGMHNAVVCTEDLPFIADSPDLRARLRDTYLGANTLEFLADACEVWPAGVIDDDFKAPWASDVPTLVLSGEADPVTPPRNGERLLETLTNARHVVGPGQGHGLAARGCVPRLMAEFVAGADPSVLDTDCVARIAPAPFFLRFTGPNP